MTTTDDIIALTDQFSAHNYKPLPVVLTKGEGVWVWDIEGRRYMDMLSAYSALNQGHRHPKIIAALIEQAGKLTLTSRAFHNDQLGPFLQELLAMCEMDTALPMNSGAEAVETAIKAARKWGLLQLPRANDHDGQHVVRAAVPRRLRALHAGLRGHSLWRRRRPGRRHR
jgi:ornithine--oxo-acid transaminase